MAQFIVKNPPAKSKKEETEEKGGWKGRNLDNYKAQQAKLAEEKGVLAAFMAAPTRTAAEKILKGRK